MSGAAPDATAARGPRADHYDVVVVGTGLAGVSSAALLAHHGLRVLAVERGEGPGGYAHGFRRGPYLFDPAIHVIPEAGFVRGLLGYLGVEDRAELVEVDALYGVAFPGLSERLPLGREPFVEAHCRLFPAEAAAFGRFFEVLSRVFREAAELPMKLGLADLGDAAARFPTLFRYRGATAGEVVDEHLSDPRLKALVTACWSYMGLPPSRLSFLHFCQLLNVIIDGSYYCRGSFQRLVDAFVAALERDGGDLVLGTGVTRIVVADGRARGVVLADGREIGADVVISNADPRQTFEQLVGAEHVPARFLGRLRRMRPSLSAFLVFAGSTLDFEAAGASHDNFVFGGWDHDRTFAGVLAGRPGGTSVNVPTLVDASLAPPGEHAVIVRALAPYDVGQPWRERKAGYADELLAACEQAYPGFRDSLTFSEAATPLVLERYSGNFQGACYGWEISPEQVGSQRASHETPVAGLYLAGHWAPEGAGSFRTMTSGVNTAQLVLDRAGAGVRIPTFKRDLLAEAGRA
jgi:phytoene dehydrogenase-like protein